MSLDKTKPCIADNKRVCICAMGSRMTIGCPYIIRKDSPFITDKAPEDKKIEAPGKDYYGGTATLDAMVQSFGKAKTRDWCFLTAYKYLSRMGKKPGNSVDQEAKKAMDYLTYGMRLLAELELEAAATCTDTCTKPTTP